MGSMVRAGHACATGRSAPPPTRHGTNHSAPLHLCAAARLLLPPASTPAAQVVFLFTSWSLVAVGRTAQEVVAEVRRQFAERPGIMSGEEKPDYAR